MNSAELKLKLFREIDNLDGKDLEEAYGILLNYLHGKSDLAEWNKLSTEQKKGIEESIEQLNNDNAKSHAEVIKKYRDQYNA
jgi:hypothetical protein